MRKILLTLMAILLLLTLTGLATTNQNPKPSFVNKNGVVNSEMEESFQNMEGNMQAAQTSKQPDNIGDQINSDMGKTAESNQNPAEKDNHQTEDIQTLEDPAQNQNSNDNNFTPPDGRIYYPTSSEEPYAYTPTYTPKETNMPIIPIFPQE